MQTERVINRVYQDKIFRVYASSRKYYYKSCVEIIYDEKPEKYTVVIEIKS